MSNFFYGGFQLLIPMEPHRTCGFQGEGVQIPVHLSVSTHAVSVYGRKIKENYICSVHYTLGDILNLANVLYDR